MAEWMKSNPSAAVRIVLSGNKDLAGMYVGEAMNFLHILKNIMNLGEMKSKVSSPRTLPDGTTIQVQSVYGQDQIIIDSPYPIVSVPTGAPEPEESCIINFTLPKVIQPMKYPKKIHTGEVAGTDYIQTHYFHDISNCPNCKSISWTFKFKYKKPIEKRSHFNIFTGLYEPDNHLIYSLSPPGYGEIIKRSENQTGGIITWKAYTETGELSRTGLGVLLVTAEIQDASGKVLCSKIKKIDVDCCHKDSSIRNVEIWWEDFGTCQPFMFYQGTTICLMPTSMPLSGSAGLIEYAILGEMYNGPGGVLYAIPELKGGCVPFEWKLTGAGILNTLPFDQNKTTAFYRTVEGMDCRDEVKIELKDRCGKVYTVNAYSVCLSPDYKNPQIQYTTLLMSCNQSQDLYALYGSAPYSWSIVSGGGTITPYDINGTTVKYTAPDSNMNCTQNPTIKLTDCCGNSATISMAVNCYSGGEALGYVNFRTCGPCAHDPYDPYGNCYIAIAIEATRYDCDGLVAVVCDINPSCPSIPWYEQSGVGTIKCVTPDYYSCGSPIESGDCWSSACGCAGGGVHCPCNSLFDARTDGMKSQGCCPLNPLTGLPYQP